jgi:hypothetical protein
LKPATRVLDVDSTLTGERVGMTIDEGALAHIMGVLTDLYSDPEMAVIREYSTNARDSHVEAGKADRPIEVTLPTALAPFLKIRDYGLGLDADDIRDIYSRYGASTKRDSDDVVGMLGLGCKSGLTYADQFTLSGIKDGVRTEVAVSRDEDGTGSMTLVAQYETDEESGVEVVVPARQGNRFEEKAANFFRFWEKGTVLVNGEVPKRVDGLWIADDLLLSEDRGLPGVTVVMGGVPYAVEDYRYHYRQQKLVAFVDIGEVQFTPSRESLQMTARTKATLDKLLKREEVEKEIALKKLVDEAPDAYEAVRVLAAARRMGLKGDATWRGKTVPLQAERPKDGGVMALAECPKPYRHKGWDERMSAPLGTGIIWLTGFEGANFTPYKRQKLDQWYGKQDVLRAQAKSHVFCIVREIPAEAAEWVDPKNILPWADVEAEKIAKAKKTGGDGKVLGSYDTFTKDGYKRGVPADQLPAKDLYFYNGRSGWNATRTPAVDLILRERPGATVVPLPANRVGKFQRDFPKAKEANGYVRELAEKHVAKLTEDDLLALAAVRAAPGVVASLDASRVQDPELAELVEAKKRGPRIQGELQKFRGVGGANPELPLDRVKAIAKRYPLLDALHSYATPHQHVYIYLNAAYLSSQLNSAGKEAS